MPRTANHHPRLSCEPLEGREVPAVLFGVTDDQRLITFDSANPGTLLGSINISGLSRAGEQILDIDVRPGSGQLYGRSGDGRVYLLNTVTGAATLLGGGVTAGGQAGFDFNPRTDRIRVINRFGENVTVDPATGAVLSIGAAPSYAAGDPFAGVQPRISALAHTNSVPLSSSTQLYGIDADLDTLVVSVSGANGSVLSTVGSLGIDVGQAVGFDIDPTGNVGYATVRVRQGNPTSYLAMVDLNVGSATVFGPIAGNPRVFDIAVTRTLTSAGAFPTAIDPLAVGFTPTNLQATFNIVFPPPVFTPPTFSPPPTPSGVVFTPPTAPLNPTLVQPLDGSLIAPLGPGLVGTPVASFGGSLVQFNSLGGFNSFVVGPPITFGTGAFSSGFTF